MDETGDSGKDELTAAGVTPDMSRLCVDIELIDDILADLKQALEGVRD